MSLVLTRTLHGLVVNVGPSLHINAHWLLNSFSLGGLRGSDSTSSVKGFRLVDRDELPLLIEITMISRLHLFLSNSFYFIRFLNLLRLQKGELSLVLSDLIFKEFVLAL